MDNKIISIKWKGYHGNQFHKRNHYLPQMYLKAWSNDNKKIWQKKVAGLE